MNKNISKTIDFLLKKSTNGFYLKIIEKLFNTGIPFNIAHKFKFLKVDKSEISIELPFIKNNKNHLGGTHACAIATLGEYCAGMSLIKNFGSSKYRLVLSELKVNYIKQGNGALKGRASLSNDEIIKIEEDLQISSKSLIEIQTNILNQNDEVISVVLTTWQLKSWNKVSYKSSSK